MNKTEFKELVKTYLRIKIDDANNRIKVCLMFEDDVIDYDFIDYSDVIRVIDRLNSGEFH